MAELLDVKFNADGTAEEIFWNEKIVEEAKICKPQIGELSEELNVGVKTLYLEQLVEAIKSKTRGESA